MNAEIRRILCATDLSGNCDHIYNYAMNLAGERDAGLSVIHIISRGSIKAAKMLAYFLNEGQKDIVKEKTYSASTTTNILRCTKKPVFLISTKKGKINVKTYNG